MTRSNFNSIDEYISTFPVEIKNRLEQIRKTIKDNVPNESIEEISYQIPCFKLNGKFIIYFAGYKNHISLYPIPLGPKDFENEIKPFVKGKGTLQFQNNKDLPIELIKNIIKYSLISNLNKSNSNH